jgi:hypothetical protein
LASIGGDYSDPASRHGLFYVWFYWLPIRVDLLFMPDGYVPILGLALMVYVAQYMALLVAISRVINSASALANLRPRKLRAPFIGSPKS